MAIFRVAAIRAASVVSRSSQTTPRASRQFTSLLASTSRATPSFVSFQRRLYSDEKEAADQAEQSLPAESTQAEPARPSSASIPSLDLPPSNKVYIGNLFFDVNAEDLTKEAAPFGPIKSVRLVTDYKGFSKGFGFVEFENLEDATRCKTELDGRVIQGRRCIVNYTRSLFVQKEPTQRSSQPTSTLFVGNLSYNLTDRELNNLFRPLKNIRDVRIAIDRRTGQPRGFAHADFLDVASAQAAFEELNGKEVSGRALRIDYSNSGRATALENYIKEKQAAGEEVKPVA